MAKTDLFIPSLGDVFIDLRDSLSGDAYNWSWERPLAQVNYLAIHSTNGPDTQTPQEIADNHININGWEGIGYHFLIDKEGVVYYVGDISTARANVANLNGQVIGIGLIGNFVQGMLPTREQLDNAHKLCEFLLNYPNLPSVRSWDKLRGHKELPNQATNCPGDDWDQWRIQIVEGLPLLQEPAVPQNLTDENTQLLQSQVDSLQTSLASVNQRVISLQEALQQRDQQISELKKSASESPIYRHTDIPKTDTTLTIVGALINLYKFVFPPGKEF